MPLLSAELMTQLERLDLVSRKIFRGRMKGEQRSKRRGQSIEFADFRNYVHGDDLRFIDWNIYARLDRLFLKLYLEEEDLHVNLLLDTSESMNFGQPTKFDYVRQLAAALGFIGLSRGHRVKVETLGQAANRPAAALRGRHNLWRLLDSLEKLEPGDNVPLLTGVRNFCLRNSGRGIVVLMSDLLDKAGYEDALRLLAAQQMDPYVIQVLSQEELHPDVQGDLRLIDCEDASETEITVSAPLLARYQQTVAAFLAETRDFCNRRGMVHLVANNHLPVEQLVGQYLRQRGLVRS